MNPFSLRQYVAALFFFATVAGGTAVADDHRINLTVIAADTGTAYEVKAPPRATLHAVKRMILAKMGLSVRHARDYVVEKVETVTVTQPDPLVPYVRTGTPSTVTTTQTVYTALTDEDASLRTLGIVDGDTLRLTLVPGSGSVHHRDHERDHGRGHHDDHDDD